MSILFCSCQDRVNIGDPKKDLIFNPQKDSTEESTIFDVKETYFNFREMAYSNSLEWGSSIKFLRKVVKMDTSSDVNYLWIDLDVECTILDKYIAPRTDRLTRFSLKLDSLTSNRYLNEKLGYDDKSWCSFNIKDLTTGNTFSYSNNDVNFMFLIESDFDNVLKGRCFLEFSRLSKFDTYAFEGYFEFKY
jgi:hypothetical protein